LPMQVGEFGNGCPATSTQSSAGVFAPRCYGRMSGPVGRQRLRSLSALDMELLRAVAAGGRPKRPPTAPSRTKHQAGLSSNMDLQQHSVPVLARHSLRDLWMPRSRGLPPPACNAGTSRRFAALLRERGLDRVVVPDHRCRSAWDRCQRPVSAQPWHQRRVPCPTHDSEAQIASTRASGLQMPWLPEVGGAALEGLEACGAVPRWLRDYQSGDAARSPPAHCE